MRLELAHADTQPATSVGFRAVSLLCHRISTPNKQPWGVVSSTGPCSGDRVGDVTKELQRWRGVRGTDLRVHTKGAAVNETMVGRAAEAAGGAGFLSPPATVLENYLHFCF